MPPEIHRASPRVGPSSMVDKIAEKSFSGMQGLMVAEDRKLKEKDVNSLPSVSNKMLCFFLFIIPGKENTHSSYIPHEYFK